MGSVVWQLNDCWPVTSWAAIDGSGSEKPLFFAIAQSYEEVLVTIDNSDGQPLIYVVNNSSRAESFDLIAEQLSFTGEVLRSHTQPLSIAANMNQTVTLASEFGLALNPAATLLRVRFGDATGDFFYTEYKNSKLEEPRITSELVKTSGGLKLTVTAENLVRDLVLMVDKLDPMAHVSSGLVTLLPGETHTFEIQTELSLTIDQLAAAPVMRSANQLVVAK